MQSGQRARMPVFHAEEPEVALRRVKLLHTAIWAFFAACILAIPLAAAAGEVGVAMGLSVIVAIEIIVLLFNGLRCPLTGIAQVPPWRD